MSKERQIRTLPTHKSLGGDNILKLGEAGVTVGGAGCNPCSGIKDKWTVWMLRKKRYETFCVKEDRFTTNMDMSRSLGTTGQAIKVKALNLGG